MSASACLTLAGIHFLVWSRNRKAWTNLCFCLLAMATAAWTFCELCMMRAETPVEFATVLKWEHVAVAVAGIPRRLRSAVLAGWAAVPCMDGLRPAYAASRCQSFGGAKS